MTTEAPPNNAPPGNNAPPPSNELTMPAGLPEQYWDKSTGLKAEDLIKDFGALSTFKTEAEQREAARAADVPEKPEGYELVLPADFKLPDGVEIKFDEKDPRLAQARTLAKELGIGKDAFKKLLALDAQRLIAEHEADTAAFAEEQKKLGDNAKTRIAAVEAFAKANLKPEQYEAIRPFVGNALAFEAIETLIGKITATGIPNNQNNGDPPPPPAAQSHAQRIWGDNAFKPNPQARAS